MKELSSPQHPLIKHLVKLRQNHDYRWHHQALVLEGIKLIAEASSLLTFKTILASSLHLLPKNVKAEKIILAAPTLIQKVSGLQSSEGILAEAPMPKFSNLYGKKYLLALDRINDPGNLGTIIRSAIALGWEGIFLLEGTCDPFNEKALRASRGAVFKIPMRQGTWKDLQEIIKVNNLQGLVADIKGVPFEQVKPSAGVLLVLSNEAQGPSQEAFTIGSPITVPMSGEMESLNVSVAAGLLLYSLRQKRELL
jgi:TrmH family RNA methyltransferase